MTTTDEISVRNNAAASQYEAVLHGKVVGLAAYRLSGNRVIFTHTEVDPELGGRGVGATLAKHALDDVVAAGKTITPRCPFIAAYLRKHPSYAASVDEQH
jgi:predicted GNAT family acetyltransferase